nr:cobalt transporter [uncultured Pseudodesulfovibrio sp.]
MISGTAAFLRGLDPRLKLAVALVLGPCLWKVDVIAVTVCIFVLLSIVWPLAAGQPVGFKMIRSLLVFVLFWMAVKMVLDAASEVPLEFIIMDGIQLGARLVALLLLGLGLALSTSARSLGLAVSWGLRPLIGKERAWRAALSLALMIHFLPICLETLARVKEVASRRCLGFGVGVRMRIVPLALVRNLSQKTWNQTLAVACRGLDSSTAWEPDFSWCVQDGVTAILSMTAIGVMFLI